MANVLVDEQTLKNIADSIRAKSGKTDKMLPSAMSTEIDNLSSGGSGGSVATASVKGAPRMLYCTCYENGTFVAKQGRIEFENAVVGSIAYVHGLTELDRVIGSTVLFYTGDGGVVSIGVDGLEIELPEPDW